jgi:hypothetical protein
MHSRVEDPARKEPEPYRGSERRAHPRYLFPPSLLCRARPVGTAEWWPAQGLDLSRGGMAFMLGQPLTARQILVVELKRTAPEVLLTRLLRVIHAFDQPGGTWRVGGQFIRELSSADLERLLF